LLALAGAALLLAPKGLPARWVGAFWCLPLLFHTPVRPQAGEVSLTALDVGQGTAIVVQTASHDLIYDTGPKFSERFDSGDMVVLPFLKHRGITRADMLLVSHGDNDHSGGSEAILRSLPVDRVVGDVAEHLTAQPVEPCSDGQRWDWDGIHFEILHPDRNARWLGNDSSCVLLIESGDNRVLLTGDIEKRAERHLLREHEIKPLRLLFAPHHGSRSSSTAAFVAAVRPEHVVFNAGLFNRFGFPDVEVAKRYLNAGAQLWETGEQGAIEFVVNEKQIKLRHRHRFSARRYWHFQAQPRFD
jgi:competence protein ComEC